MQHVDIREGERDNLSYMMVSAYHALREASAATGLSSRKLRSLIAKVGLDREAWGEYSLAQYAIIRRAGHAVQAVFGVQDMLAQGYQKLVARCVRQVRHFLPTLSVEDAMQEANITLIDAIFGFNGSRSFTSWVATCIRRRLIEFHAQDKKLPQPGDTVAKVVKVVRRKHKETRESYEQILDGMGITGDTRKSILGSLRPQKTVQAFSDERDGTKTLFDLVPDKTPAPDLAAEEEDEKSYKVALVTVALEECDLNDYERSLIELGMEGEPGWQTRLAQQRGVTRAGVSAAYVKALGKLRASIESLQTA